MRIHSWLLVVLLALMVGVSVSQVTLVPALAGENVSVGAFGVSFPLWKTTTSDVTAGKSFDIEFHKLGPSEQSNPTTGYYKTGFLEIPVSRYSVSDATRWMAVKPRVLGIEDKYLQSLDVRVGEGYGQTVKWDGSRFWFDLYELHRGEGMLHEIVIDLVQNQSRQDDRGVIPWVLQIFGRKTHRQITKTEYMVASFGTYDVSDELQSICKGQFGASVEDVMKDPEQASVLRSCVYWPLVQTMRVDGASLDYNLKAQSLAVVSQRFAPPMARQQGPSPELLEYQRLVKEQQELIKTLVEKINKFQEAQTSASAPPVPPAPPAMTPVPQATQEMTVPQQPTQAERLRAKHTADAVVIAIGEESGETVATIYLWVQKANGHWVPPDKGFTASAGDNGALWYSTKAAREGGYKAFSVSSSSSARGQEFLFNGVTRVMLISGGAVNEG